MPAERPAVVPGTDHNWWQAHVAGGAEPDRLVVVATSRHPDGVRVPLDAAEADTQIGRDAVCTAVLAAGGVTRLELGPRLVPDTAPLWYAELVEPDADPPACTLVAFTEAGQTAGALVPEAALEQVWVDTDDQLGAIRWFRRTGEVDQVYVAPDWRRRGVGSALIAVAATLNVARDLPRLWGAGRRTELGEQLRNARSWRARTAELTELVAPMTPE